MPKTPFEPIVGAAAPVSMGQTLTAAHGEGDHADDCVHDFVDFAVVGTIPPTGTPWDRTIPVPVEAVQLQLMGAFAEFERNIIRKRQAEGIAKPRGVYQGRKKTVDDAKIIDLKWQGKRVSEIAAALGASRMTVYRALGLQA